MSGRKYYWLKFKKDFFKRHDVRIIESMPNGKDYVLFYLKLLVESVDYEGSLRFSQAIPYSEDMLSTITNTNVDVVRSAMKVFNELGMVEILDDRTIFMNEVSSMLGTETAWAEKKRKYREEKGQCPQPVLIQSLPSPEHVRQEIEKEKDIELEKDKEKEIKEKNKKKKSTSVDFQNMFSSYSTNPNLIDALYSYLEMRNTLKPKPTEKAMKLVLSKLDKIADSDNEKIQILENSIMGGWKGVFPLDKTEQRGNKFDKAKSINGYTDSSGCKVL